MTDPKFTLKKVNKTNCSGGWNELHFNKDWRLCRVDVDRFITFNDNELEELRRVLDIGMGDCDHCDEVAQLRTFFAKGQVIAEDDVLPFRAYKNIISHDMKRLMTDWGVGVDKRLDNIEGQIANLVKNTYADDTEIRNKATALASNVTHHIKRHDTEIRSLQQSYIDAQKRIEWRLDHNEDEILINNDGYHALAKCIDDIRVELERVKTDMSVMKFAFTTHMGVSHEQDK
jgi:hypothetical protein